MTVPCDHPWERMSIWIDNVVVAPGGKVEPLADVAFCECGETIPLDDPLLRAAAIAFIDGKLTRIRANAVKPC